MADITDGYFVNGLLCYGDSLTKETYLAKGMRLDLPDIRHADNATKEMLTEHAEWLLAALGDDYALQIHWSVENDYHAALDSYKKDTETALGFPWCYITKTEREHREREKMRAGNLRRERLYLYIARKCDTLRDADLKSTDRLNVYLEQQARNFEERLEYIQSIFSFGRCYPMGDEEHLLHLKKFFNPSLARQIAIEPEPILQGFRPDQSILQNSFHTDGVPFESAREKLTTLYFDEHYHAIFVLREWPKHTEPGMMHAVTNAVTVDYSITYNIYPCSLDMEIQALEKERDELMKQVEGDKQKFHLNAMVQRKEKKLMALMTGRALPFKVLPVIKIWDKSIEGLATKCVAVKGALQRLSGCRYHQCNHPAQAKNLFLETIPGFLGGKTRAWDQDAMSPYLSNLLPLTSTFTAHLEEPQILLETPQGSLAGMRIYSGETPQMACLVGMRGAGKSTVIMEILSQTEHLVGFTGIIEEGLSYGTYAQLNGYQSLVLRPGSTYTWNYFDTVGLPLTPEIRADATALLLKMIGTSKDEDTNKLRGAIASEYLDHLWVDAANDWQVQNEEKYNDTARRACAIEMMRRGLPQGASFLDAYVEMRDLEGRDLDRWNSLFRAPSEAQVIAFSKKRDSAALVRNLVFTQFKPENFPTHSALCALLKSGRLPHHKGADISRELDRMHPMLAKWRAVGGMYGPFVDGATNIKVNGRGLHVELGYLGDSNRDLKEVAGFLATSKMRQMIINLPRGVPKRMIYEEVGKFLTVPNAADILAENYAQFRKFYCWVLTAFQNPEQLDRVDAALLKTIRANSTQFWFMRHQDAGSLQTMADPIGLPLIARGQILKYQLPEHQRGARKATYFTLFSKESGTPVCGTVQVEVNPYMLYVASSNGKTFDERSKALLKYDSVLEGVMAEVDKKIANADQSAA